MTSERFPPGLSALGSQYEMIREIGRGGTSVVYLARERATNTDVAIKLIRARYLEDDEALGRFTREARFLEQLVHPNIVRVRSVLDLGEAGTAIVMAHVPGRSLKELILAEGRLSAERAERFTRDIARALETAHAMGIVHRDVKPENIFVDADDRPLLADFGLARSMTGDSQLTMAGVAIGTPAYMAPEQIEGASLDARGDVYSLGLVAWEMLSGHRPWEGESLYAVLYHQRFEQLPDIRELRDDVPDTLADAIAVAIEKNRDMRWQTAAQMIEALDGAAPPRLPTRRPTTSADTVRFLRPTPANPVSPVQSEPEPETPKAPTPILELGPAALPPARAPREPSFIPAATLASIVAELDAQDEIPVAPRRKKYALAAGGLIAAIALVVVAASLQSRSGAVRRPPPIVPHDFAINDSPGRPIEATNGATATSSASGTLDSTAMKPKPAAPAPTVASSRPIPPSMPEKRDAPPPSRLPVSQQSSLDKKSSPSDKESARTESKASAYSSSSADKSSRDKGFDRSSEKTAVTTPAATVAPVPAPVAPALSSRVIVTAGGLHSCMLTADGRAYCWGGNDRGQLGGGGANAVSTPLAVTGDVRFAAIATGLSHSCGIARGGGAWCWGENDRGQLGDRSTMAHQSPMRVADSRLFTTIGVGAAHTCALDGLGAAYCWGSNSHGQLGSDIQGETTSPIAVAGGHRFSTIALGWNFTCGLDDGRAYCWGENANGQLGDGSIADRHTPVPVGGSLSFRSIAAGNTHACGITSGGEAYCWGNNLSGQLGDGTKVSRGAAAPVKTALRFVSIAVGALHTCAVTGDGAAYCWGRDNYGQLGNGGGSQDSPEPVRVAGDHEFASIRAFGSHTCGTTASGEAFCWGYNLDGQLGDGSRVNRARPVYVEPPPGM